MKPDLTVSAHPQRCSQKLLIGLGMKLQKAVGLWQSSPLPDACGIHLSKHILPCRNWALEINLLATLMQKESENGTQEIPADSFIWKGSEHIQRRLSPWIYRKAEHQLLCFFTSFFFFKWMPGELQSLIIFLHLKLIRFVLPLPPLPPTSPLPYTSSSLQLMRRNQCIALSGILLLKWQESLVTKVICCLIEIFSQLIAMQTFSRNAVVEPSIDCPPTPSFFLLSLQINCTLLYSFYQKRKIN